MTPKESSASLKTAIQTLLLPISGENLDDAVRAVELVLERMQVPNNEHIATLEREWRRWTVEGDQSPMLTKLLNSALSAETGLPSNFAGNYFKTYKKLVSDRYLPPAQARSLLGNVLLIQDLLANKNMSCTQIARVLSVTQSDHAFNWEMVQPIARALGLHPQLNADACDAVYFDDAQREEERFGDASPQQAIDIVADIGDALGYEGSLYKDLKDFFADYKPGYGIMLHMGCLVLEFYDHPPKEAPYEFQPRGAIAADLAKRFHSGYRASESPYLNNAKGAANLDAAWAWARQPGYIGSALALAALLDRLGSMPYPARKQLAPWIRQWLHRIAREQEASYSPVDELDEIQIRKFLSESAEGNTKTRGVLDQRVVDLLASALHTSWENRGLGDFVNASNVRKRKTGDVEFSRPNEGVIIAYEAHGGPLANVYVDLHRQTLRQVLRHRNDELSLGRTPEQWSITIKFIAHALGETKDFEETIDGYRVKWEFATYKSFFSEVESKVGFQLLMDNFGKLVINPINNTFVPETVRDRFRELAGLPEIAELQAK